MQILINPDGSIRCLYDETMDLSSLGHVVIARGSHVEPDALGNWFADLAPVSGPRLGPFPHRSMGLAAERVWLEQHWLLRSSVNTNLEEDNCDIFVD